MNIGIQRKAAGAKKHLAVIGSSYKNRYLHIYLNSEVAKHSRKCLRLVANGSQLVLLRLSKRYGENFGKPE